MPVFKKTFPTSWSGVRVSVSFQIFVVTCVLGDVLGGEGKENCSGN